MYTPKHFSVDDVAALHAFMRDNSFAILATAAGGALTASHLPFHLDAGAGPFGLLQAHMARANPQWRQFADGAEALVLFQGAHTYISPSWYQARKAVPTWNYVAVHAYGRPRVIEDHDETLAVIRRLVAQYESPATGPWSIDSLPVEYVDAQLKGIVAFDIPVERLEGKYKLSQNRPAADREGVIAALKQAGGESALGVARLMEALQAKG